MVKRRRQFKFMDVQKGIVRQENQEHIILLITFDKNNSYVCPAMVMRNSTTVSGLGMANG